MAFLNSAGPIAFAHRGGSGDAPENTMPAFEAAVALGYRWLETDVHLTADGAVVAFHDDSLDRVTDRRGRIAELSLADVRAADAGYSHTRDGGRSFPFRERGVTVPTLEELLTAFPEVLVNIDVKSDVCVGPLVHLLGRLNALDRVCLASFSERRLVRVRGLTRGRVCTSMGRSSVSFAFAFSRAGWMPRFGADCVQVPVHAGGFRVVSERFLAAAHRAGLPVHVWTVNDEAEMIELLDLGVDGIMTDQPRLLRSVLEARGVWSG